MKDTFGEFIRKQRESRGLPIRKVASELDIDQSSLSKYERGERLPPRECVTRFADLFNLSEEELMIAYVSDKIVLSLIEEKHSDKILEIVIQKLRYYHTQQYKQGTLNF